MLFVVASVILFFAEGAKQPWYPIYVLPYYAIFGALMIEHFTRNTPARLPAVAAVLAVVVIQVAGLGYSINLHH